MGEWVAVIRDPRFSPNAVEKDRAILQAVADRLGGALMLEEQDLLSLTNHDLKGKKWLSMGRRPETLDFLRMRVGQGTLVINNPEGVARCKRTILRRVMENLAVPVPPKSGTYGHWVKRDDGAAQTAADIVYVPPENSLQAHIDDFLRRGINEMVVEAHIPGDVVKFYGVDSTGFFRIFYPSDDGMSKFGQEKVNGPAGHYVFDIGSLQRKVESVARFLEVPIYGGDAIVTREGRFFVIDFNDWPSFSRCRDEAADAIASLVEIMSRDE